MEIGCGEEWEVKEVEEVKEVKERRKTMNG